MNKIKYYIILLVIISLTGCENRRFEYNVPGVISVSGKICVDKQRYIDIIWIHDYLKLTNCEICNHGERYQLHDLVKNRNDEKYIKIVAKLCLTIKIDESGKVFISIPDKLSNDITINGKSLIDIMIYNDLNGKYTEFVPK